MKVIIFFISSNTNFLLGKNNSLVFLQSKLVWKANEAYGTNGGRSHFYPNFIVKTKNEDIYIIETKGGETHSGQDKNITLRTS